MLALAGFYHDSSYHVVSRWRKTLLLKLRRKHPYHVTIAHRLSSTKKQFFYRILKDS